MKSLNRLLLLILVLLLLLCLLQLGTNVKTTSRNGVLMLEQSEILDFESFDNQNGSMTFIVPNIVHLLYLNTTTLKFYQAINIYSIYLNHRPDLIYIHCDLCSFRGHFWSEINSISDLKQRLRINQITFKDTIFGVKYGWVNHHRSDVWRLLVLMHHGGIYLDTDVFVVNSLDKYRVYEMTVSYEEDTPNAALGTQVMIAHRNARLLKAHFDAYRTDYKPKRWFYNAGQVPGDILRQNPDMAHVVEKKLGTHDMREELYFINWPEWRQQDTIHLLINQKFHWEKYTKAPEGDFNSTNILDYNFTYGYMCRDVMSRIKKLIRHY